MRGKDHSGGRGVGDRRKGSIMGSIVTRLCARRDRGTAQVCLSRGASNTPWVFVRMVLGWLVKPTGLTGRAPDMDSTDRRYPTGDTRVTMRDEMIALVVMVAMLRSCRGADIYLFFLMQAM